MLGSERRLLTDLRATSRVSIVAGLFISLLVGLFFPNETGWQVVLAIVALALGIPHGAMDHSVTVPKMASLKMVAFVLAYLLVTGIAIWFILAQNVLGFQLVVLMSALHFGFGDASFHSELNARTSDRSFPKIWYALAAGFTPVGIPLVTAQSQQALELVNPVLVGWSGWIEPYLLLVFISLNLIAVSMLLFRQSHEQAIDLLLLLALSLFAPPLVAFAFYFGFWHALRHTGRLSLELQASRLAHEMQRPLRAFWLTVIPGLPALIFVLAGAIVMVSLNGFNFGADLLWYLLVLIWALTVPHMALTSRLDLRSLRAGNSS